MLAIRLQRTGRKGHAQFRVIVQDARRSPSSGKVVERLGNYNPHSKELVIDKDKAKTYLTNGAQPSDKIVRLLQKEGIKMPDWVKMSEDKERTIRHQEKLRKNRPAEKVEKAEETSKEIESSQEEETPVVAEEEKSEESKEQEDSSQGEEQEEAPKSDDKPEPELEKKPEK